MVVWIIGLSGAGKSSLGRALVHQWRERERNVVLVDGDQVRCLLGTDGQEQDYSLEGRRRNAETITRLCTWLDAQGMHVVCCILSLFPEMRATQRTRFSGYREVFIDAPLDALRARDGKKLYAEAAAGLRSNVVGVDIPFPRPTAADLVLHNDASQPDWQAWARQVTAIL